MHKIYYFLFVLFFIPCHINAQGEWNNWYFGWLAAMTFNFGNPIALNGSVMFQNADAGTVSLSDSLGNLLFYSNGWNGVWNKNNIQMPNSNGLVGGMYDAQTVLAVPKVGDSGKYYLFTVGDVTPPIVGLHYSLIDMSLQGGLGDIVAGVKNIAVALGDSAVDCVSSVRHRNNKDIWVVVRKHGPHSKYLSYLITASGISSSPVVSPTNLSKFMTRGGDLRISQDGTKLVCSDTLTEICNFNDLTGVVTPRFLINAPVATGAEFSVDTKYLYLCTVGSSDMDMQTIAKGWQFDMSYTDSSNFVHHQIQIGDGFASKLQLAPNWKIYCGARYGADSLHCINNPSLPGPACNYQKNAVYVKAMNNGVLPQFLQRYKAYFHLTDICYPDTTRFTTDIWPPPDSIHWNFGDPASGAANFSNLSTPSHLYSGIGTYTIELFVRHIDNRTDTSWRTITIYLKPQPNLGPDRTICLGDSTTFDAGACSGCTYIWKNIVTGLTVGTSQTFRTGQAGTYDVTVTNSNQCIGMDTVQLITTPVPSVINNPLSKSICSGDSTDIVLTSNVPGTIFHWTASLTSGNITGFSADSGLVINQVLVNLLSTPGIVTYHITPKVGSCAGNTVDFPVTVTPGDSVKVSITASTNNVCAGTPVTFTATPTNPGTTPIYQWKVNGINSGTNSTTFTYTPLNNDIITCILLSSLTGCILNNPATSNGITMVVNPVLPVSVSVAASQNPVCSGTSVIFTATATNGGSSPQ
ncbi:MAG: PKD-like domain-containing protein, partial [Bacteroidales bacterium]